MSRVERILSKLAQRHAPHLLASAGLPSDDAVLRVQWLARKLAHYSVLPLVGELAPQTEHLKDIHVEDWIQGYARLYHILAGGLFPSLKGLDAHYADEHLPVIVVLDGAAAPVISTMAGYVTPYLALRHPRGSVPMRGTGLDAQNTSEITALMDTVLLDLEAGDLPRAAYAGLRDAGVQAIQHMLFSTVRTVSLTPFDQPVVASTPPVDLPQATPAPQQPVHPAPSALPEDGSLQYEMDYLPEEDDAPLAPTEEMFVNKLPLPRSSSNRMPPVPRLPEEPEP